MPVTVPGLSISEASKLLQIQDKLIKGIPEVAGLREGRACRDGDRPGAA